MFLLNQLTRSILIGSLGLGSVGVANANEQQVENLPESIIQENSAADLISLDQNVAVSSPVVIQTQQTKDEDVALLSAVVVTGSRTREARTVASSPTPIDVLSNENLEQSNQRNLLEALNHSLPSFNVPTLPGYGINSAVKAGQLRGLNSSHTLVLVNGKRRHSTARLGAGGFVASAPVDLGLIPTGAIERIEVLRDGAAAIYGSDAIAGVINIITKKTKEGGELSAKYGEYSEGDGGLQQYIASKGFEIGDGGHLHLSAQWDKQASAFRDSPVPNDVLFYFPLDTNGQEVLPTGNRSTGPKLPAGAVVNPKETTVDRNNVIFGASGGVPESTLGALTADFSYPVNENTELYAFASYADRETKSPQHFRFATRDQVVRALYPDGFTPFSGVKEKDYAVQLGLKGGDFYGWEWDISSVLGRDEIDAYQYQSNSPSFGLDSKKDFYTGQYQYRSWVNNLDLKKTIDEGLFGNLTDLSIGAEYRKENYQRKAGELQSWAYGPDVDPAKFAAGQYGYVLDGPNKGAVISKSDAGSQADTGVRPEDTADDSRNNFAFYTGLSFNPTDKWVVDTALRYENFSDFGDIITGRLSSRYNFSPKFALRGTYSTGFQAPALAAQGYKATNVTVTDTDRYLSVNSVAAQALGAKSLTPEESKNISLGFVLRPTKQTSIAIDAYRIDVTDRISALSIIRASDLSNAQNRQNFEKFVQSADPSFGPNDGISYFINAGKTKTEGLDITVEHIFPQTNWGTFKLNVAANWNKTELVSKAGTPSALTNFGFSPDLTYNASSIANLEYLAPRFKSILGLNWSYEKWHAGIAATRYGKILRSTNVNVDGKSVPQVYDVGNMWLVDAHIGYDITSNLSLSINGTNILDEKPGLLPQNSTSLWPFQSYSYLGNSPVNAAGSFYSAGVTYKW